VLLKSSQSPSVAALKKPFPPTIDSTWVLFFFLVSFPWFWVSLSSFLLLSPLLEPSSFFLLSVRSLLGAVAVTLPKKNWLVYVFASFAFSEGHVGCEAVYHLLGCTPRMWTP